MRIAVIGAGGVGAPFGSALARAGIDVWFVVRGAHLEAMRRDGLYINGARGNFHLNPVQATDDPSQIGKVDFVLSTVKLWDVENSASVIKPLIDGHTGVVTLQNGIDAPERLGRIIGDDPIIGGVAIVNAAISSPGHINQMGEYQSLTFGELNGSMEGRVQGLKDACDAAGIDARVSPNIIKDLWEKFVFLVSVSTLTAASRQRLEFIRSDPDARATLIRLLNEVTKVGQAAGVPLSDDLPQTRLAMIDGQGGNSIASMAIDLLRGNRLELPWLASKAVELGRQYDVQMPALQALVGVLRPFEMGSPTVPDL